MNQPLSEKNISENGSVRVDLLGGTLDIDPINLILPNVITLNCAISLQTSVTVGEIAEDGILIFSDDYHEAQFFDSDNLRKTYQKNPADFGHLRFVLEILISENIYSHLQVTIESAVPSGSGLGGSSTMGITLYKALKKYLKQDFAPRDALKIVSNIEKKILNMGPCGYQDYYPALYGGILALHAGIKGVSAYQLYNEELKKILENHITLIYSGESRHSGINNWEVFKNFFDDSGKTKKGLSEIAEISYDAYMSIKNEDYKNLISLIEREGKIRSSLFPNILTPGIQSLQKDLSEEMKDIGLKMCGAGGGGHFLLTHPTLDSSTFKQRFTRLIEDHQMKIMPFCILAPNQ